MGRIYGNFRTTEKGGRPVNKRLGGDHSFLPKIGRKVWGEQAGHLPLLHTKGIIRLTSSKQQKPVHTEEKCRICQRLIGISKKPDRDIDYETLKQHLGFQGVKLQSHLTFLRRKGLVPRKFGRQHFEKTQKR